MPAGMSSGPVPTPPTSSVLRSYSIAAEPCLAAISVLDFRSRRASHKLLQVGCDIRLKAKEMGFIRLQAMFLLIPQLSLEDSVLSYFSGCSASISMLEALSNL
jgi:hypothetical protein